MSERICMFCNHLSFDPGRWSEETNDDPVLACEKDHFDYGVEILRKMEDFRRIIIRARDCPDYDEAKP